MKCSSRRNCSQARVAVGAMAWPASMKCSSRRNCSPWSLISSMIRPSLNEVQFPEELQLEA